MSRSYALFYTRGDTTPIKKLITLFSDLEELIFGEAITRSWL